MPGSLRHAPSRTRRGPTRPRRSRRSSAVTQVDPDPPIGTQRWWLEDLRIAELDMLSIDPAAAKVRVAILDLGVQPSPAI